MRKCHGDSVVVLLSMPSCVCAAAVHAYHIILRNLQMHAHHLGWGRMRLAVRARCLMPVHVHVHAAAWAMWIHAGQEHLQVIRRKGLIEPAERMRLLAEMHRNAALQGALAAFCVVHRGLLVDL